MQIGAYTEEDIANLINTEVDECNKAGHEPLRRACTIQKTLKVSFLIALCALHTKDGGIPFSLRLKRNGSSSAKLMRGPFVAVQQTGDFSRLWHPHEDPLPLVRFRVVCQMPA